MSRAFNAAENRNAGGAAAASGIHISPATSAVCYWILGSRRPEDRSLFSYTGGRKGPRKTGGCHDYCLCMFKSECDVVILYEGGQEKYMVQSEKRYSLRHMSNSCNSRHPMQITSRSFQDRCVMQYVEGTCDIAAMRVQ